MKHARYKSIKIFKERKMTRTKAIFLFRQLIGRLIEAPDPLVTVRLDEAQSDEQRLVNAFLILLTDAEEERIRQAKAVFTEAENEPALAEIAGFLRLGLRLIPEEMAERFANDATLRQEAEQAVERWAMLSQNDRLQILRKVFFPEGLGLDDPHGRERAVKELRQKRAVRLEQLNPNPIREPLKEILFTSNLLLTAPLSDRSEEWDVPREMKAELLKIKKEPQKYWYDHPIPVGIGAAENEALYGLQGLEQAVAYEKTRRLLDSSQKLNVVLSASVTHQGLHRVARPYFEYVFSQYADFKHLRVFIFTEEETKRLIREVLAPLAKHSGREDEAPLLAEIFGVDGEYGRHYSFLKAIGALWQVFADRELKATFKIDLDQVFDQPVLERETGQTAFQHFTTFLWGARGRDADDRPVELGMIAGALVNQKDIEKSLFTPDVTFPAQDETAPDEWIFFSRLPQALSTEAEMMARYGSSNPREIDRVLQRVHVTGGTNGILIDALRKHRPFTPSVIGRAEDQAYLLSVLFARNPALRYVHKDGLIMRHDKEAFAGQAIQAAAQGKLVGDYVRILFFSYYARALPWDFDQIKNTIDPFTGCFVSRVPVTVVFLRALFKYLHWQQTGKSDRARELLHLTVRRVTPWLKQIAAGKNPLKEIFIRERRGWDLFYDLLDSAEEALAGNDSFASVIRDTFNAILEDCRVKTEGNQSDSRRD